MASSAVVAEVPNARQTGPETAVLIRARGIRKAFGGQVILDGIDLDLRRGEVVLLRGENGSGKTTLLNVLAGVVPADSGEIEYTASTPRTFRFPLPWWHAVRTGTHFSPEAVAREGIVRTWQDVRLFNAQSLLDNIAVAAPAHPGESPVRALFGGAGVRSYEQKTAASARAMLARLGLEGREGASADRISLGQSKRVAIGRAIATGAQVLYLDEPLASLDRAGIGAAVALLETLVHEQHVTLIVVEHVFNHEHLDRLVTTDWQLADGSLRCAPRQRARQAATVTDRAVTALRSAVSAAGASREVHESLPRGARLTRLRREGTDDAGAPALEIRTLTARRGPRVVVGLDDAGEVCGFSLTVRRGEIALLEAPNGWGKSTLVGAISGLEPASGRIALHGRDISLLPTWDRAQAGLGVLLSDANTFPGLRGEEVARLARLDRLTGPVAAFSRRPVGSLSGGEQQRVSLATLRTSAASVWILDEPFTGLDTPEPVIELLAQLRDHAVLVLLPSPTEPTAP